MFDTQPGPREMQLTPWSRNEIFVIKLKYNSIKYTQCTRTNSINVNVWFYLLHKRRLKEKHFSELLQLWEIALEGGGSGEQTELPNELPKILIEEKNKF